MRDTLIWAPLLLLGGCGEMPPMHADRAPMSEGSAVDAGVASDGPPLSPAATGAAARLSLPKALHAVGTEPFWAATLAGGTLTYSTPEVQAGTAIPVTRSGSADEEVVTGKLGEAPLRMRITAAASCSDGMSDTIYPYKVELTIAGEHRLGCAQDAANHTRSMAGRSRP